MREELEATVATGYSKVDPTRDRDGTYSRKYRLELNSEDELMAIRESAWFQILAFDRSPTKMVTQQGKRRRTLSTRESSTRYIRSILEKSVDQKARRISLTFTHLKFMTSGYKIDLTDEPLRATRH